MIYKKKFKIPEIDVSGAFLAGGAVLSLVTNQDVADYDIYPKTKKDILEIAQSLISNNSCYVINVSDRSITFKSNSIFSNDGQRAIIQIITFQEFPTAESIFEKFDFTVCMAAYDFDTSEYIFHDSFWPDVSNKRINFNNSTNYPIASMARVSKYAAKGYKAGKAEMLKMALTLTNSKMPESWEELAAAIGGFYGKNLETDEIKEEFNFDNAIEYLSEFEWRQVYSDGEADVVSKRYNNAFEHCDEAMYAVFLEMENSDVINVVNYGNVKIYKHKENVKNKVVYSYTVPKYGSGFSFNDYSKERFPFNNKHQVQDKLIKNIVMEDYIDPNTLVMMEDSIKNSAKDIKEHEEVLNMTCIIYNDNGNKKILTRVGGETQTFTFKSLSDVLKDKSGFYVVNVGNAQKIIEYLSKEYEENKMNIMNCEFISSDTIEYISPRIMYIKTGDIY